MKKTLLLLLTLLLILCACGFKGNPRSPAGEFITPDRTAEGDQPTISKNLRFLNQLDKTSSMHEKGFYFMDYSRDENGNIKYLDFETMQEIYLCAKPNCAHNDDTCTSFVKYTGCEVLPFVCGNKLFLMFYGSDVWSYELFGEDSLPHMDVCELNGENRTRLFTLENSATFKDLATDGQKLYGVFFFSRDSGDGELGLYQALASIDLATGSMETLQELTGEGAFIRAVYGDTLYLSDSVMRPEAEHSNDNISQYFAYNTGTGSFKQIASIERRQGSMNVYQGEIYQASQETYEVTRWAVGEEAKTIVTPQFIDDNGTNFFLEHIFDDKLWLYYATGYGTNNAKEYKVAIDVHTGQTTQWPFDQEIDYKTQRVYIMGEYGDKYLCLKDESWNSAGEYSTVTRTFALITKSDFWAAKENFELFAKAS